MKNLAKISVVVAISTAVGFFSAMSFSQIEIKPLKFDKKISAEDQKEFLQDVLANRHMK